MIVFVPLEMAARLGSRSKPRLAAMDSTTTIKIVRLFLLWGIITARNIPYSPTLRALTTLAGSTLPMTTPKNVPNAQPGITQAIIP